MPSFTLMGLIGGGIAIAALSALLYFSHRDAQAAKEMTAAITVERDQWKSNAGVAVKLANANADKAKEYHDDVAAKQADADALRADLDQSRSDLERAKKDVKAHANHQPIAISCPGVASAIGSLFQPATAAAGSPGR